MLVPLKLVRDQPLQRQMFEQFASLIHSGRLTAGARMPSTRMVAGQFGVSRITVLLVYDRLIAEGCLETIPAKGTFVSQAPVPRPGTAMGRPAQAPSDGSAPPCGGGIGETRLGRPDPTLFPLARWRALLRNSVVRLGTTAGTDHGTGAVRLRHSIAGWLATSRGLAVSPDQVILVSGRQQALHLVSHLLLPRGGRAVLEDPCDPSVARTYAEGGADLLYVRVDERGIRPEALPDGPAALLYVTPEHQRPSGALLSAERRAALLDWAGRSGAMVVEDDYDGEIRYGGIEAAPLMSLDGGERVLHIGCFATALGPWVTLGYIIVPISMAQAARNCKRLLDDSVEAVESAALAEFLESGAYARHVHRLHKIYSRRRDALLGALRRHFGPVTTWGTSAGLHLAWHFPKTLGAAVTLAEQARHCGLEAEATGGADAQALLLGFGTLSEAGLECGIDRLAAHTSVQTGSAMRAV